MSAFKQFLAQDVIINPFTVNKSYLFNGLAQITGSNIDLFIGQNTTGSFIASQEPTTGLISTEYKKLIYTSAKSYYANHLSSSYGDKVQTASLYPGRDEEGNVYIGEIHTPNYNEYPQTTLTYRKIFPTLNNSRVGIVSIPSKLYGDYIQPKSFSLYYTSSGLTYDVQVQGINNGGITTYTSASAPNTSGSFSVWPLIGVDVASIVAPPSFYDQNTLTYTFNTAPVLPITFSIFIGTVNPVMIYVSSSVRGFFLSASENNQVTTYLSDVQEGEQFRLMYSSNNTVNINSAPPDNYILYAILGIDPTSVIISDDGEGNLYDDYNNYVGNIVYSHGLSFITNNGYIVSNFTSSLLTCSFSSSYDIYETQYKCTIRENEFNFSLNPSLIKNNNTGSVYDFVTGSYFSPYITTVGLYDDEKNLLAIGKLAQPVQVSPFTDTSILINIDRV